LVSRVLPDFSGERELCAIDGITAAFGALFPAQMLSSLLAIELGFDAWQKMDLHASLMEIVSRTAISSSICYVVFTSLGDRTLLKQFHPPIAASDILREIKAVYMFEAIVLGLLSGVFGMLGLLILGIFQKVGSKVHDGFDWIGTQKLRLGKDVLGTILTPTLGGALVGLLYVSTPLLFADGADQQPTIVTFSNELGTGALVAAGLLKLVATGVSLGFGFVGGQLFPFMFTGTCLGAVAHLLVPSVPLLIAVPCCMAAVPCAFLPLIFTFTVIASVAFSLGGVGTTPVFLACAVAHTVVAGVGIVQRMVLRASQGQAAGVREESEG